jgi:hypothetical protein
MYPKAAGFANVLMEAPGGSGKGGFRRFLVKNTG